MLELKSKNLFVKKSPFGHSVVSKVLDFYELIGMNILFLHSHNSDFSSWVKFNKQEFNSKNLKNILSNNLFRLDLIVVHDLQSNFENTYRIIRQVTDLPVIFIVDSASNFFKSINIKNFDTAYILFKSGGIATKRLTTISSLTFDSDRLEDFLVESIKDEWKSNLKEIKIQYIRDKNLRDLLGED